MTYNQASRESSSWHNTTLSKCAVVNDSSYSPREAWPFVNYLETSGVTDGVISEMKHLDPSTAKIPSRARRKVKRGDIVYSTVRPNQRHYGLIKDLPENCLVSTGFAVIRAKPSVACTGFIYWYLTQQSVIDYLQTIAEHSTSAYPSIKPKDLMNLPLKLPPLSEQHAIAHVLGLLDDKIDLNGRMNKTLEKMARAVFRSWFVDFDPIRAKMDGRWRPGESLPGLPSHLYEIFPTALVDSELGPIPEGWKITTAGEATTVKGGTTPKTKEPAYWGGEHWFTTPKDLSALQEPILFSTSRQLTDAGVSQIGSRLLPAGTLLLSSRAPIGYLAITQVPVTINQGIIAMICNGTVGSHYALNWTHANMAIIEANASGTTFSEISKSSFRSIPFLVPSAPVHAAWESIVAPLYSRMVSNVQSRRTMTHQRDTLLPPLLSGELKVKVPV